MFITRPPSLILQVILPRMNVISNYSIQLPNNDSTPITISQISHSAPLDQTTPPSFLEGLLGDAPETLPILRQSCIQVLNLTQDKRSSASNIGDIIKRDQAMMANIVKIANSSAYYTRGPVKTPTHAVALIGFDVIQAMVVFAQLIEQTDTYRTNST